MFGVQWMVKRGVDFDGVEKIGEIGGFVEASRPARRIDDPGPIRVGPSRRADADSPRSSFSDVQASRSWLLELIS